MKNHSVREFTIRGVILGFFITVIFMAANIYLGLKVGLTVASSIPAAVISMGVLRYFKGSNILENNLVQTQASAGGTLSAVIFVLPGLLLIGYWQHFPFWETFLICAAGGILGVIFTIPLRRVLVVQSPLPYPEGVAAAEVLRVGATERKGDEEESARAGEDVKYIFQGGFLAAVVAFATGGLRWFSDSVSYWFSYKNAIFQIPFGFSLALLGAGYLIGMTAAIAMVLGTLVNWNIIVPILSLLEPLPAGMSIQDYGIALWKDDVRLIGVGVIGTGAIWTLIILTPALLKGLRHLALNTDASHHQALADIDRDVAPPYLLGLFLLVLCILAATFYLFINPLQLSLFWLTSLILLAVLLAVIVGFMISAACGYMAGILGSSSSPISSIALLTILLVSLIFYAIAQMTAEFADPRYQSFFIALAILVTAVVISLAAVANDNLQDLKTGYLVGATPAKQEWILIIGCVAGALVLAPILNMLFMAYGFTDLLPREGMDPTAALNAPQATLISILSRGIFSHHMDWQFVVIGMIIGIIVIPIDKLLRFFTDERLSFPPLAFGMGIYLPPSINIPIFFGALLAWLIKMRVKDQKAYGLASKRGVLFASGLIVGESLMGIILAFGILLSLNYWGTSEPFTWPLWGKNWANILGLAVFFGMMAYFYRKVTAGKTVADFSKIK